RGTLQQLTDRLGLSADVAGRIWAVEEGELHVIAPPSRLSDNRRGAMREVALLTAVGRQAGGWDASTALTTLRSSCDSYGPRFFDPNNFNNAINDLGDELKKLGDGKELRVRVTPPGFDAGIALATRLGSAVA